MSAPVAVVFDCDGVLVDSEPHSVGAWIDVLGQVGHPGTRRDIELCLSHGFDRTHVELSRLGSLPDPAATWPLLMGSLRRSFERGLHRCEDAVAVLDAVLNAQVPFAVASASPRQRLDLTLEVGGFLGVFDVSVAGDEVAENKPAPDVYLAALDRLGVSVHGVVAIEDSPGGVASAIAAGLTTVAVAREPEHVGALAEEGAVVVDRLTPGSIGL